MAKTNRNGMPSTNVQALDNLDLDDMFADGGDDLFDGLDIDLGNMDDITAGNNEQAVDQIQSTDLPPPAPLSATESKEAPKRRKTKRKTTTPTFFDDQEELEMDPDPDPPKKKKRLNTTKKRNKKASAAEDESKTSDASATKKTKIKTTMPPPPAKITSGSSGSTPVAGRIKKVGAVSRNTAAASNTETDPTLKSTVSVSASTPKPPKSLPSVQKITHPGLKQGTFCGLLPSKTLFYPFMPSLPTEVAFKNRKIYSLLDRIHSVFTSKLTPPNTAQKGNSPVTETEPIVQLMQESFKDEKSSTNVTSEASAHAKNEIIAAAVGSIRSTIESMDKTKLAHDLLAVCALLQRQHDFLKQNAANMERWCKDNFTEEEFSEVYLPPRGQRKVKGEIQETSINGLILWNLAGLPCKVRVSCTGLKDPKTFLQAIIPSKSTTASSDPSRAVKLSKKTPVASEDDKIVIPTLAIPSQPTSYAQLRPAKRRKAVADLIAQTAYALEYDYLRRVEKVRQYYNTREKRARETAQDSQFQVSHTTGMWKWLEEMGYFEDMIDEATLRDRLDDTRTIGHEGQKHELIPKSSTKAAKSDSEQPTSYVHNLLDLLVDIDNCSDGESSDVSSDDDESSDVGDDQGDFRPVANLSGLSQDERAQLHLRCVGLSRPDVQSASTTYPTTSTTSTISHEQHHPRRDLETHEGENGESIDVLIEKMKADLHETANLNQRRGAYLETMARFSVDTPKERNRRMMVEASLHARHTTLLKRSKEAKAKNGKLKNTNNDDLALPW